MPSGWLIAISHSPHNLSHARRLYRIPIRDFLLAGGQTVRSVTFLLFTSPMKNKFMSEKRNKANTGCNISKDTLGSPVYCKVLLWFVSH
jgi:hypothetical protein